MTTYIVLNLFCKTAYDKNCVSVIKFDYQMLFFTKHLLNNKCVCIHLVVSEHSKSILLFTVAHTHTLTALTAFRGRVQYLDQGQDLLSGGVEDQTKNEWTTSLPPESGTPISFLLVLILSFKHFQISHVTLMCTVQVCTYM